MVSIYNLFVEKLKQVKKPTSFKNEDELYTFAHYIFMGMVKEIEQEVQIDKDDYEDHEEWYDEYHDEIVQLVFQECMNQSNPSKPSDLKYIMVNVIGNDGYSFMVTTKEEIIIESNILDACATKALFYDVYDIHRATIETEVTDKDIKFFSKCTYNID